MAEPTSAPDTRMTHVTVTLPDGSRRSVPAGTTVRELMADLPPRLAKSALAAVVDDRLVDLSYRARRATRRVRIVTPDEPGGARRSTATARRTCWRPRSPTCSPARSAASVRRPTRASSTTSSSTRPFVPEDLEAIEEKMRELAQQDLPYERQMWPRERGEARSSRERGEPLKVQLIEEKTEGQADGLLLHDQGPRHLRRLLRRPARAVDRQAEGVQAAHRRRTPTGRATRATSRCSASTARRSSARRTCKAHLHAARGSEEARPPQARAELGLFMFHPWAPGAAFWLAKGTTLYNTLADYMRGVLLPGRLRRGEDAARLQQGALGDVRPLAALPPEHVPRRGRGRADGPEGDELPGPHARVRAARCAATATCRSASTSRRRCTATRRRACSSGLTRVRSSSRTMRTAS